MNESNPTCIPCLSENLPENLAPFFAPLVAREGKRLRGQLRRAQAKGLRADLTLIQWLRILAEWRWACAWCKGPFESLEHLVPVRSGGGTTATNCVPACIACNQARDRFETLAVVAGRRLEKLSVVNCEL